MRYNPELAIKNVVAKLGFKSDKLSLLNLTGLAKTEAKVKDVRDKSRPMVRKANSSNTINPLTVGEAVSLDVFPIASQEHIKGLIPLYLDLLLAQEQVYLPSLEELGNSSEKGLIATHPFIAYAIALFNLRDKERGNNWLMSFVEDKSIEEFQSSFAVVDRYWEKTQKI